MKKDVIKIRRKKESKGNEIPIKVEGEDSVYVKPVYREYGGDNRFVNMYIVVCD